MHILLSRTLVPRVRVSFLRLAPPFPFKARHIILQNSTDHPIIHLRSIRPITASLAALYHSHVLYHTTLVHNPVISSRPSTRTGDKNILHEVSSSNLRLLPTIHNSTLQLTINSNILPPKPPINNSNILPPIISNTGNNSQVPDTTSRSRINIPHAHPIIIFRAHCRHQ